MFLFVRVECCRPLPEKSALGGDLGDSANRAVSAMTLGRPPEA
jgi:hypothetical protein